MYSRLLLHQKINTSSLRTSLALHLLGLFLQDILPPKILPALLAVPLLGQLLVGEAAEVEPLPLAVDVLTHDHFPIGGALTVAVPGLVGVVLPLLVGILDELLLQQVLPLVLLLAGSVVLVPLVQPLERQFAVQLLGGLVDVVIELHGQMDLLLSPTLDLLLQPQQPPVIILQLPTVLPPPDAGEHLLPLHLQFQLLLFDFLIQVADLPQQMSRLRGDEVELMQVIVVVGHVYDIIKRDRYFKSHLPILNYFPQ